MSWNAAEGGGDSWDNAGGNTATSWNGGADGGAAEWKDDKNEDTYQDDGAGHDADGEHVNGASANDGACFNCGEQGHMKSECPKPRENSGACFNCGQTGHNKADCPNPAVPREFTGTCRLCEKEGHRAADCPDAAPKVCKNCGEEGHPITECKNPRKVNRDNVPTLSAEAAWEAIVEASRERDLDDVKTAIETYSKSTPDATYGDLEKAFRAQELSVFIIALEREIAITYTNMDLQGNLDRKYAVSYRFSDKPARPKEANGWPSSAEENMDRLKDAGTPVDRGIPKCGNCDQLGHTSRSCPEEKQEVTDRAEVKCYNCDGIGHRVRDCPVPRADKFACRNCKQSGHSAKDCPEPRSAEGVECKKCGETGHFARDCPTGGGGGGPMVCRNCDEEGHISKECPKPRDWSRVKCSNCQEMGHTKVRCKKPLVEDADGDFNNNAVGEGYEPNSAADDNHAAVEGDAPRSWEVKNDDAGGW